MAAIPPLKFRYFTWPNQRCSKRTLAGVDAADTRASNYPEDPSDEQWHPGTEQTLEVRLNIGFSMLTQDDEQLTRPS